MRLVSEIGPVGAATTAGTPYRSFVFKAQTEREAMNGLMQLLLDAIAAEKKAKTLVWRSFPHVLVEDGGVVAARVRCCFE